MNAIARQGLPGGPIDHRFWPSLADRVARWLDDQGAAPRDAVLLLPSAALLAPARVAFARRGGWQPRVETPRTLAAALGPVEPDAGPGPSGEAAVDRLAAAALLRRSAPASLRATATAFDAAVSALVEAASALQQASAAQPPAERDAWWQSLREALPPLTGPGAAERLLARIALEWAATSGAPNTDRLWGLRPSAWVALSITTPEPLITELMERAERGLWLDAAPDAERPFVAAATLPAPRCTLAAGLEDEAQAATLALLEAIDRGLAPVALIAQDRLVVRRIRALLERAGVSMADETGWTLATTRAGASLMALLRAASPGAGRDALVEAFKLEAPGAASALEAAWRREREPSAAAQTAFDNFNTRLAALRGSARRPLAERLATLQATAPQLLRALAGDSAGTQALAALHLDGAVGSAAWQTTASGTLLDHAEFVAWVDAALEAVTYRPPPPPEPQVVITPLARALLRPFAAMVMPGCDERHLGARPASAALWPDAVARRFGLPDAASAQQREGLAFAQALRAPELHLLRRTHEGAEALAASALLQRAALARRRLDAAPLVEQAFAAPAGQVVRRALARPAPSMAQALPERLSASTLEALRDCPYRFFARVGLGLNEPSELEAELEHREHGLWKHALLYRFHTDRRAGQDDRAALLAIGDDEAARQGLDAAALLPFRAGLESFADQYLAWLNKHEHGGWRFAGGEIDCERAAPALEGLVKLHGVIDRIDRSPDGASLLIDYKTGNPDKLRKRTAEPLEDTQLAFYAALVRDDEAAPPRALYLALDDRKPTRAFEHDDVAESATLLIDGVAADWRALRSGAGAPALGEGDACRHCAARGLCRRDQWS
jgi:ATP-dependent helicase/nuclease subunit B